MQNLIMWASGSWSGAAAANDAHHSRTFGWTRWWCHHNMTGVFLYRLRLSKILLLLLLLMFALRYAAHLLLFQAVTTTTLSTPGACSSKVLDCKQVSLQQQAQQFSSAAVDAVLCPTKPPPHTQARALPSLWHSTYAELGTPRPQPSTSPSSSPAPAQQTQDMNVGTPLSPNNKS